jgi:hypothetical protein
LPVVAENLHAAPFEDAAQNEDIAGVIVHQEDRAPARCCQVTGSQWFPFRGDSGITVQEQRRLVEQALGIPP